MLCSNPKGVRFLSRWIYFVSESRRDYSRRTVSAGKFETVTSNPEKEGGHAYRTRPPPSAWLLGDRPVAVLPFALREITNLGARASGDFRQGRANRARRSCCHLSIRRSSHPCSGWWATTREEIAVGALIPPDRNLDTPTLAVSAGRRVADSCWSPVSVCCASD